MNLFVTCLDEQFLPLRMISSCVHSRADGLELVFHRSRTVNVGFTHTKRPLATKEILTLVVTGQSLLTTMYTSVRGDPVLGEEPGDHDGLEGEVDARVLSPLYSSADRRFFLREDDVLDSCA